MSGHVFRGVGPFLFRRKASRFQEKGKSDSNGGPFSNSKIIRNLKKASTVCSSRRVGGNFVNIMELKNKISTFRDLLDFTPCIGSTSLTELLIMTLKDISKRYSTIRLGVSITGLKEESMHKSLKNFCDALKLLGDFWTTEMWMVKSKYDPSKKLENHELEKTALELLDDIIKLKRELMFDESDDEEDMRDYSPQGSAFGQVLSESYSDGVKSPHSDSPATPTSVLPESRKACYSPPMLLPLRVQEIGKLSPIDLKHISLLMFPQRICVDQDPKYMVQLSKEEGVGTQDSDKNEKGDVIKDRAGEVNENDGMMDNMEINNEVVNGEPEMKDVAYKIERSSSVKEISDEEKDEINISDAQQVAAPVALMKEMDAQQSSLNPSPLSEQLPSPPLMALPNGAPPPPPPPVGGSKGPLPLPPASMAGGSVAPPPPPGSAFLCVRKSASKLKRSSQMGNLYRLLRGKVEGSSLQEKSSEGRKGKVGASSGGKQGMADALAEMTKKSAYFQRIEEDVKNFASVIKELKTVIISLQTSNMNELIKVHKYVESHLEKLTDETQVLARFEDFPSKKLEALRMAVSLYNKLDTISSTLQDWPTTLPLGQLLDKSESYFTKIKVELDALERTKDEEAKKLQAQKITFDFGILIRIKEQMVDISSNCMEMALKEANAKQNDQLKAEAKNNESIKLLWRAFQFAFRVYTFAGGQDDRAERLTRELAHEIEIRQ